MPKQNQSVRINQLASVVVQLAMHMRVMAELLVPGSEEIQKHLQQLADIAEQVSDGQVAEFDLSPQVEEVA